MVEKCLEGLVFLLGAQPAARAGFEIGTDGVRLDPAAALDNDRAGRLRNCDSRGGHRHTASTDKDPGEDQAIKRQSPNHPHTNSHALRALLIHAAAPTADSLDGPGWHRPALYSVFYALQTKVPPNFPFPLKKLPVSNGHDVARCRMSLKVAKIINITTIARPILNPSS